VIVAASPAASQVVPGILGFLVVAGMGLALFFLLRSMNKQLNKVAREPRWREEAKRAQQDQPAQAEQDYRQNGTPQQG
jgi:large-conductance mechanosensitive channel